MKTRIISAAVGVLGALIVLVLHNTIVLEIAVAAITSLMLYELFNAGKCLGFPLTMVPAFIYGILSQFLASGKGSNYRYAIAMLLIMAMFLTFIAQHKVMSYKKFFYMVGCTVFVSHSMSLLIILNDAGVHGLMYLITALCGAWLADSGAYFAGTFFGRRKLCPEVSPKKTVEGFLGGILINGILFMIINFFYSVIFPRVTEYEVSVNYFKVFILGVLLAVVGTIGDLSASVLKRQCGLKDYGNIMPGHGGAMDRFDSVLFVVPCFFAFVSLINIYS